MSSVRDLVDALMTGDTMAIDKTFNDVMAVKVTSAIDAYKDDVAQAMFTQTQEESEQPNEEDDQV